MGPGNPIASKWPRLRLIPFFSTFGFNSHDRIRNCAPLKKNGDLSPRDPACVGAGGNPDRHGDRTDRFGIQRGCVVNAELAFSDFISVNKNHQIAIILGSRRFARDIGRYPTEGVFAKGQLAAFPKIITIVFDNIRKSNLWIQVVLNVIGKSGPVTLESGFTTNQLSLVQRLGDFETAAAPFDDLIFNLFGELPHDTDLPMPVPAPGLNESVDRRFALELFIDGT